MHEVCPIKNKIYVTFHGVHHNIFRAIKIIYKSMLYIFTKTVNYSNQQVRIKMEKSASY